MNELKERLKRLHEELAATDAVDPELQGLLQTLDGDIHKVLQSAEAGDSGLAGQAESVASRFRARHPRLEPLLRELAETLTRLGI